MDIESQRVTVSIANASISGGWGWGPGRGGGITVGWAAAVKLIDVTVSGNKAGPRGTGGGIYNAGTVTITRSTISGNTAQGCVLLCGVCIRKPPAGADGAGGGIHNVGTMRISNSTISGNAAIGGPGYRYPEWCNKRTPGGDGLGGGIYTSGSVVVTNSTIAGNQATGGVGGPPGTGRGGGVDIAASPKMTNDILANNAADRGPDCKGTVRSEGHNLLGRDRSCHGFTTVGDVVNVDPLLGPLQDNGGPTFTMALLAGSRAIDAGDDVVCAAPPVHGGDQRGIARPQGPHCDIGAFEAQGEMGVPRQD